MCSIMSSANSDTFASFQIWITLSFYFFFPLLIVVARWVRQERIHLQFRSGFDPWVGKIPLDKGIVTHSSILAWEIPWTEEPGRLQSMGSQRDGRD